MTVDVIVPIYNASAELENLLASVARHTSDYRLILIDDGSTDPGVASAIDAARRTLADSRVIRHQTRQGFAGAINTGLAASAAQFVVLLNSDTIVTSGWLRKLLAAAESRPYVATVTPLTNNGTICSVPAINVANDIPQGYTVDSFADLIDRTSPKVLPEAPTGVGFCMLIARPALDAVGWFDASAFGFGYGEENDFCQRAIGAGFVNLIADDAFVYHKGGMSFGVEAGELLPKNLELLNAKYPRYSADVRAFVADDPLAGFRQELRQLAEDLHGVLPPRRARVLHLLHSGGGTEKHARELAQLPAADLISYVGTSDGRRIQVDEYSRGQRRQSWIFPLEVPVPFDGPATSPEYERALRTICDALAVDLIHVHHLGHNTLEIATVARRLGIPYFMTLHDYHVLCPRYTLLDPHGDSCGACIGRKPSTYVASCVGRRDGGIVEYQKSRKTFLDEARRLFAPSSTARGIVGGMFADIRSRIEVVEHAMTGSPAEAVPELPPAVPRFRLNVAVIGGLEPHKGLGTFRALLRANRRSDIVFHLFGWTSDCSLRTETNQPVKVDSSWLIYHGPYESSEIVSLLRSHQINLGLHLSVWEETFSFTLSEFATARVPVITGSLGAQAERVRRAALGWTVSDIRNAAEVLKVLHQLAARHEMLLAVRAAMRPELALPQIATMWNTYADAYREAIMQKNPDGDRGLSRCSPQYVRFLARQKIERGMPVERDLLADHSRLTLEVAELRARLRSPRHRFADVAANALHRIPVVWPIVARLTDAWLKRREPA